jgi:putative oxidoreductase
MLKKYIYGSLATDSKDYWMLVVRLALGTFMFVHWAQKLFGWFGWNGYTATMDWFTGSMGIPFFIAFLVIIWESLWAVALILWHKVRFMAIWMLCILIWAVYLVHFKNGWFDYELHFLAIAMCIALIIRGWGAFSLDNIWKKWFQ